jgi:hypothetical protein
VNEAPKSINDLVNEALTRWLDLTEITFDKHGNVKHRAKNSPWQNYTLGSLTEGLNESRDLDPTGLTTFMMMRGLVEAYLRDIKFSAETLILNPASIEKQLLPMRAVRDVLENPEVVQLVSGFQDQIRTAALHYGVQQGKPMDALEELLNDKYDLATIRRDALLSMRRLQAHQFSQGKADTDPPKYSPQVYEFWNVNSLLLAMRAQKFGGISLILIRDPEEALRSYFIFAIKNGFTFTILTDKEKGVHPMYERMSRRPDRNLERRAEKNWFPYGLLDLKKAGKHIVANVRTQLVPINVDAVPVAGIHELHAEEFVWLILMFDLIRDKFWTQGHLLPELSYTGQMVIEPQALVGADGALVKEGFYKPLEMPALSKADVTAEKTKDQWERDPTHYNAWMVERYGHRVPEEVFNVVGEHAKHLLEAKALDPSFLPSTNTEKIVNYGGAREPAKIEFEALSPVTFGVKAELQKDRLWTARLNQMKAIQVLADKEYEEEKDNIIAWYQAAIEKNREFLLNACARGELKLPSWKPRRFGGIQIGDEPEEPEVDRVVEVNALHQKAGKSWYDAHHSYGFHRPHSGLGDVVEEKVPGRGWRHRMRTIKYTVCAEQPRYKASIFTDIRVSCPEAIAIVCGVTVAELPWPLQHWYDEEPYHGNSILDRLDPEDWVLKNPWAPPHWRSTGLRLNVGIAHGKIAFNARRKALGLPIKSWAEKKDADE